jgi:hypothetical protein
MAASTIRMISSGPDDAAAARFDDVKRLRVADVMPDAPKQGVGLERLHDDVVWSDLIVEHLVRIRLAGHDDDGDPRGRRMFLHLVVHPASGYVGHHQVEQYQVRPAKLGLGKALETVSSLHDVIALLLEDELLELADGFLVFNYEDRLGHGRKISAAHPWAPAGDVDDCAGERNASVARPQGAGIPGRYFGDRERCEAQRLRRQDAANVACRGTSPGR